MSRSRWYGSLRNRIMENSRSVEPQVGMGATECMWSDRHPYEVIEVTDDRHITVRSMSARRIDNNGMSDCQEYEYSSNEDGCVVRLFKNRNGRWVRRVGRNGVDNSSGWIIGFAEKYYDFSF